MDNLHQYFATHQTLLLVSGGLLGLIIGSFLNVVIYRLPLMLQKNWRQQCLEFLKQPSDSTTEKFDLASPRSHCTHCKKTLSPWMNIPLLSFILLRGKCPYCQNKISKRYPLVELLSTLLSIFILYHFGFSWAGIAGLIFTWALLALIFIDIEHQLLPDEINLGLLWLGLLLSLGNVFVGSQEAILGAAAGYLFLWCVGWLFKKLRGIEGIGFGDYKLFAVFGAWFGWELLPFILLIAALLGTFVGLILMVNKKIHYRAPLAFGPYLAIAGWIALCYGSHLMQFYMAFLLR